VKTNLENLDKTPYAIQYKKKNVFIPAIIFKHEKNIFVALFRYKSNKGNCTKIFTEAKLTQLWIEKKIKYFTPLDEFLTEEEKYNLNRLVEKLKNTTKRKKAEKEIRQTLIKIGKRLGLQGIY